MNLSPELGTKAPQWGLAELICMSVRIIVRVAFWQYFVWPIEFNL